MSLFRNAFAHARWPRFRRSADRCSGQSLVEFGLVLPIMLIILLTVADFGRLFAMSLTVESATRAAAEAAATDYQRATAGGRAIVAGDYPQIHRTAWSSVCDEGGNLPGVVTVPGSECSGLPTVVCVHDSTAPSGGDPQCSDLYNGSGGIPAGCPNLAAGTRPTNTQTGGSEPSKYVEVRVCYQFTTLFNPIIPFVGGSFRIVGSQFAIERIRTFTIVDY
jgi:hypothetical protein